MTIELASLQSRDGARRVFAGPGWGKQNEAEDSRPPKDAAGHSTQIIDVVPTSI